MHSKLKYPSPCLLIALLMCLAPNVESHAEDPDPKIQWPDEWVVFAPLYRSDPVLADDVLRTVSETVRIPATKRFPERTLEKRTVPAAPGKPVDLSEFMARSGKGANVAYVFIELQSPKAQQVTLGLGADWWLQAWMNGDPFF